MAELRIKTEYGEKSLLCPEGESLLKVLTGHGYRVPSPCGGKGSCGKCRVQILQGISEAKPAELRAFSEEELRAGWRLACKTMVCKDMTIYVPEEEGFEILEESVFILKEHSFAEEVQEHSYQVAIDIGTTTLVLRLAERGAELKKVTYSMLNHQRVFGADVISRIQAATGGQREVLQRIIRTDLADGLSKLAEMAGIRETEISQIAIGGNTTMIHLLLGYDCSGLGGFPFTPVSLDMQKLSWNELVGDAAQCTADVTILPGISAFVGGDITAGLYACGFDKEEKICLLIDLGTNGEMAVGNRHRLLVTSTAAGPAFEGGNISCGTGSVEGAVSHATLEDGNIQIHTIGEKAPIGICGSGVVELTAELLKAGYIDETGLLAEEFFEEGFPVGKTREGKLLTFTQGDIRELQLAKAAVRAGMEVLIGRYQTTQEQIDTVYVAGGFGYGLDIEKAIAVGMFPEAFREKIKVVGNGCLAGVERFLSEDDGEEKLCSLCRNAEELNLATDAEFQERYMNAMMFGEEK